VEDWISGLKEEIDIKEKRTLRQKTQELWKEYVRIQQLYQKSKPENHWHRRRIRCMS
jgi:hypothetical protein